MAKDRIIDINFGKYGFRSQEDTTSAPIGSLRVMRNAQITDRGGLAPRLGTVLLGSNNSSTQPIRGFYNFRKSLGSDELLVKTYDDEVEFISKTYQSAGWTRLKNSFTVGQEFGFTVSLVNTDNEDYVVFCNRYEPYQRWTGAVAQLTSALVGAETAIPVDSTLLVDIYESRTASASSATTLDISPAAWAADQWNGFYVRITSGVHSGKIRAISATTTTQITFATLGSDPVTPTFEIRKPAFPASGTLIYGGTTIAYTAIPTDSSFSVASAHAAADDSLVTLVPTEYPAAPKGNRLTNYLGRIVVGNVRSALARNSVGALAGYSSAGSAFVSKLSNPFDFSYSATRVAGEGDIIATPYGGGDITDVSYFEDTAYVFKERYIEAIKYSQDTNDLAVREPLKAGIGSVGKTLKGADGIYFLTPSKQLTNITRVKQKDIKPATLNIGETIKIFLEQCNVDDIGRGIEIAERAFFPLKSNSTVTYNDVLLVWNRDRNIFEGIYDIGAFALEEWNGKYYYAQSNGANVYELFNGYSDVEGENSFGIDFRVDTHWMNLTSSKAYLQALHGIVLEGRINSGATFDFFVSKDFSSTPFLSGTFAFTETGLLDGENSSVFLGSNPLSIGPLGVDVSDPDSDGVRHFSFRKYFPFVYGNYFSLGFTASETDNQFEITRAGLIVKEDVSVDQNKIK